MIFELALERATLSKKVIMDKRDRTNNT